MPLQDGMQYRNCKAESPEILRNPRLKLPINDGHEDDLEIDAEIIQLYYIWLFSITRESVVIPMLSCNATSNVAIG